MGKYRPRFNDRARSGAIAKQRKLKTSRQPRFVRRPDEDDTADLPQTQQDTTADTAITTTMTTTTVKTTDDLLLKAASNNSASYASTDPNALVLVPMTEAEKLAKRTELEQLLMPPESKFSKAKKKRFEKYIERQLKREEKKVLLKKLAGSKFDTTLLHSLKKLGTSTESRRNQLREALLDEKLGLLDDKGRRLLYEERQVAPEGSEAVLTSLQAEAAECDRATESKTAAVTTPSLKRTLEDTNKAHDVADGEDLEAEDEPEEVRVPTLSNWGASLSLDALPTTKRRKQRRSVPYSWRAVLEQTKLRKAKIAFSEEEDSSDEEGSDEDEDDSEHDGEDESVKSEDDSEVEEEYEEWFGIGSDVDEIDGIVTITNDEGEDGTSEDEERDGSEEDGEDDDDETDSGEAMDDPHKLSRGTSFKEWAERQLRGGTTEELSNINTLPKLSTPYEVIDRPEDRTTPPPDIVTIDNADKRKSFYVQVRRSVDVQAARMQLPVVQDEQQIMEAVNNNLCVIICGETGSGKTTQVPQFLFEAGYGNRKSETPGMIGITQPRRVAAVSMAARVSNELGPDNKNKVAYQVRFEQNTKTGTAMKYMTDGVLLRELSQDLMLSQYSAIIIDEAHERNVNTDILIGVLSRVLKLRYELSKEPNQTLRPLKLIIMSATLRVSDFLDNHTLFNVAPPVLKVEARQYPVANHFSRRTQSNYADEAFKKVCKIHRRLPPGGILIFLTGQNEITSLCRRLKRAYPRRKQQDAVTEGDEAVATVLSITANEAEVEAEDIELGDDTMELDMTYDDGNDSSETESDGAREIEEGFEEQTDVINTGPLYVLPLYSLLPTSQQLKIFESPPADSRMCVVATNVAETSLTIPGIRYVVDCGRSKERHFNEITGVQKFDIGWISKASADQRSGRAGRTGPGHCYRLYSSAVYERDFAQFTIPEILRMPIEGVVLQMKSMGIDTIANFPFPTPPDRDRLVAAERLLHYLGALNKDGQMTDLGKIMSVFPLAPRFAKILAIGQQFECLQYVIAIVAGLSVGDPFLPEHELGISDEMAENVSDDDENGVSQGISEDGKSRMKEYYIVQRKFAGLDPTADVLKLLSVICAYEYETEKAEFCFKNFLREKSMEEIHKLRQQLTRIVATSMHAVGDLKFHTKIPAPSAMQIKALKQIVTTGFIDQVVVRADLVDGYFDSPTAATKNLKKRMKITDVPYLRMNQYTYLRDSTLLNGGKAGVDKSAIFFPPDAATVYVHPSSVLVSVDGGNVRSVADMPPFLVYNIIQQSSNTRTDRKPGLTRIRPLTSSTAKQLAGLAKSVA
ncbi:P-loop containing nucleoside triphosphate hydrolase protein [Limtongia smithiae]|uniref:P-loop containing nucleoside triphosphate hydrolase protein n=1 Tax=Limtongia smithiae TaxID=1125753 RepID=UPI0034CFF7FC